MRHRKAGRKLNRSPAHRKALLRNLAAQLFAHGRIVTTRAKAKFLRPYAERLITLARKGGLSNYRRAIAALADEDAAKRLFETIAPHFKDRPGGYTRLLHYARYPRREGSREYYVTMNRMGDNAPMALVELVGYSEGVFGDLFAKPEPAEQEESSE